MTTCSSSPRGVSEVVGYLILLVIVMAGITLIILFAGSAVDDFREETADQQVDDAFTEFRATVDSVIYGHSDIRQSHRLGLASHPGVMLFEEEGRMTVEIVGGDPSESGEILDKPLHRINYQQEERRVIYQNGAVFATDQSTAVRTTVSAPNFHFYEGQPTGLCDATGQRPDVRSCDDVVDEDYDGNSPGDTLALTAVSIAPNSYVGDEMQISQSEDTETERRTINLDEEQTVEVTIESEYWEQWAEHIVSEVNWVDDTEDWSNNEHVHQVGSDTVLIQFEGDEDDDELLLQLTNATVEFQ